MKVKIEGKTYDTTKAEVIATYDSGLPRMDLDYIREALYKQDGVLFLAGESGARGRYAKNEETGGKIGGEGGYILSLEEAKEWIELTQGDNAAIAMLLLVAHRTLEEARTLGVGWGDCYPVCYGDDLCIDDVLDSNGRLLWGNGTGDDLVIDDSYEYARPKTKKEKEEEEEEEENE